MKQINDLLSKEFKALVIRILTELEKRINKHSKNFNKDLENVKNNQWELNMKTELNWNTLEGINRRLGDTEHISDLEDRTVETRIAERNTHTKNKNKQTKKRKEFKGSLETHQAYQYLYGTQKEKRETEWGRNFIQWH